MAVGREGKVGASISLHWWTGTGVACFQSGCNPPCVGRLLLQQRLGLSGGGGDGLLHFTSLPSLLADGAAGATAVSLHRGGGDADETAAAEDGRPGQGESLLGSDTSPVSRAGGLSFYLSATLWKTV